MRRSLGTLVNQGNAPLGYPPEWVEGARRRIAEQAPFSGSVVLSDPEIGQILTCEGLWQGERDLALETVESPSCLQSRLTRELVKDWLVAMKGGDSGMPFHFVDDALNDFDSMDDGILRWIGPQSALERLETSCEISAVICRIAEELRFQALSDGLVLGPVANELDVDGVILQVTDVDLTIGSHRTSGEALWPGAVLVGFVPERPTAVDVDRLGFGALVHTLATGCPPGRVVSYGLLSGQGIGLDVERDWLDMALGGVLASIPKVMRLDNGEEPLLEPGDHCAKCPLAGECPFSQVEDNRDW